MTIAELQQSINLFVEAIEKLQADKSEALPWMTGPTSPPL